MNENYNKTHRVSDHLSNVLIDKDDGNVVTGCEALKRILDFLDPGAFIHDKVVGSASLKEVFGSDSQ